LHDLRSGKGGGAGKNSLRHFLFFCNICTIFCTNIVTTQYIPLSECRKNISTLWKKATQENIRYIVMVHSAPAFEITPFQNIHEEWDTIVTDRNKKMYQKAKLEQKKGETFFLDDLKKELLPVL